MDIHGRADRDMPTEIFRRRCIGNWCFKFLRDVLYTLVPRNRFGYKRPYDRGV